MAFTPTGGSRTGIVRGPRLSVKGLSVVPPFRIQGRRPRGAPGRMFFFPSFLQPMAADHPPPRGTHYRQRVSQHFPPPFPPSLSQGEVVQTGMCNSRASRKESCLTEFKVGEKVIGWNVCQTHSELVAASLAKSVPATKDISE